jgi:signal transduction histidine kinase
MTASSSGLAAGSARAISDRILRVVVLVAPAVIGAMMLALWIMAEAGRFGLGPKVVVFALLAIAVGISGWQPRASLVLIVAVPLLQFAGVLWPPESTTWPIYGAFAVVGFFVGIQWQRVGWRSAVGAGVMATLLAVANMLVPHSFWYLLEPGVQPDFGRGFELSLRFGWLSWTGHSISEAFVVLTGGVILYLIAWAAGAAISLRGANDLAIRARTQLGRSTHALRRAEERSAIAREVHDTLAHSLAVVVAQADGGVAAAQQDPEAARQSLGVIADVSRAALVECRTLIERIQEDPIGRDALVVSDHLGAHELPALMDRMRSAGLSVDYRVQGEPRPLSSSLAHAVYRITQESLTNALKHGGEPRSATVTADWRGEGLALLIESRSPAEGAEDTVGNGLGIASMSERARLSGGWLTAGSTGDGAFLVTAFIPTPQLEASSAGTDDV